MPVLLFRRLFGIFGAEEHGHVASLELCALGHSGNFIAVSAKLLEQLFAERRVRHFAAAETNGNFDPVAIFQELLGIFDLGIEVVGVDARGHANLLDLDDLLVLSGFLFLLELLEPELAVVHDLADRGNGVRRDLDQIEIFFFGQRQSSGGRHNTKLIAFSSDHAEFLVPDFLVDLMF